MKNHTTESDKLHSLREEVKKARHGKRAVTVNIEDAIFTRLVEAEELLTVVTGLFTELAEDRDNRLFNFKDDITDARWTLHNAIHDRKFGG